MQAQATLPAPETTSSRAGLFGRVAPIACGCALAAAAGLVARFDPAAQGSRFPACQFKLATGMWCPGCGLTRGFHQLFNGNVLSALSYNLFVPLVLVAIVGGWWSWLRSSWGHAGVGVPRWLIGVLAVWLPVTLVAYGVVRNISSAPFSSLAP